MLPLQKEIGKTLEPSLKQARKKLTSRTGSTVIQRLTNMKKMQTMEHLLICTALEEPFNDKYLGRSTA